MLGLRSLNLLLKDLEDYNEILYSKLKKTIEKKKIIAKDEIDSLTKRVIYEFATLISFVFINKISKSIASTNLAKLISKINAEHSTYATKLISIVTKLEFKNGLDADELIAFNDDIKDNHFLKSILKIFVINHLYIFDVGYQKKQRIYDKLNIDIKRQKEIAFGKNK